MNAQANNGIPQNIAAEEEILGGIILDPGAMNRVKDKLRIEMFTLNTHRVIYAAMVELNKTNKPTDLTELSSFLQGRNLLDMAGGTAKLGQLLSRIVSAVNIDRYAQILIDKWKRRKLIELGNNLTNLGYDQRIELDELITQVFTQVEDWIGIEEIQQRQGFFGKLSYVATSKQANTNYSEVIKLEAEIDPYKNPTEQIKKLQTEAQRLFNTDSPNTEK